MARSFNGNLRGAAARTTPDDLFPGTCSLTQRERLQSTAATLRKIIANAKHFPTRAEYVPEWQAELDAVQAEIDNLPDPTIDAWYEPPTQADNLDDPYGDLPTPTTPCALAADLRSSLLP